MVYPNQYQNQYPNGMNMGNYPQNPMPQPNPYMDRLSQLQSYQNNIQMSNNQMQTQPTMGLNGKIVPDANAIAANDVPMDGNVALFPKQDYTEIYAKSWTPNGTIQTVVYRPLIEQDANQVEVNEKTYFEMLNNDMKAFRDEISERFDSLEQSLANSSSKTAKTSTRTKKEVGTDE